MVLYNQTTSSSNAEARSASQLRMDAAEVHRSDRLQHTLQAMITLKELRQDSALETLSLYLSGCQDQRLRRTDTAKFKSIK